MAYQTSLNVISLEIWSFNLEKVTVIALYYSKNSKSREIEPCYSRGQSEFQTTQNVSEIIKRLFDIL